MARRATAELDLETIVPRPLKKSQPRVQPTRSRWALIRLWCKVGVAVGCFLLVALTVLQAERFVHTDARFRLISPVEIGQESASLTIQGLQHTPRKEVLALFERDFGRSLIELPPRERRAELLAMPWVRTASVQRVWPNRVTVTVTERTPIAFVPLSAKYGGTLETALIDADGMILALTNPAEYSLPVLVGVQRSDSVELRRERVRQLQSLLAEIGPLADQISEINVSDLHNLKVTQPFGDHALTLLLGRDRFRSKLENVAQFYPQIRRDHPNVSVLDLRVPGRITIADRGGHGG